MDNNEVGGKQSFLPKQQERWVMVGVCGTLNSNSTLREIVSLNRPFTVDGDKQEIWIEEEE